MEWARPKHSKGQISRAGSTLIDPTAYPHAYDDALAIINHWRACHYYPLNTFKVTLRRKAHEVDHDRIVAQRIKRLASIDLKLRRFTTMQLGQMQDIAGCRAIVGTSEYVRQLVTKYERSDLKHQLYDIDDYISKPKDSGYRGVHLKYRYFSDKAGPSIYNGFNIEMQLRSRLQHAWATAVETVGTFLRQSLKSSQGEEQWLRFFALMGSVIALREGCNELVPETPAKRAELISELRQVSSKLNAANTLQMYGHALNVAREGAEEGNYLFLLKLEPREGRMTITGFPRSAIEQASERYLEVEREISSAPGAEAVLVSVDSINTLQRAYPNYFLDTNVFVAELKKAVRK